MSATNVAIDASKERVAETISMVMQNGKEGENVSSFEIAQAIAEVLLGLFVISRVIEMPFEAFSKIHEIADTKDGEGLSIIDRASASLKAQMNFTTE